MHKVSNEDLFFGTQMVVPSKLNCDLLGQVQMVQLMLFV